MSTAFQSMVKYLYGAKNTVVSFANEGRIEASMSIELSPNCLSTPVDFWVTDKGGVLLLCTDSHEKAVPISNRTTLKEQLRWALENPPVIISHTLYIVGARAFLIPDNDTMRRFNADCMENHAGRRINPMDKDQAGVIKFLVTSQYEVNISNVKDVKVSRICMLH